MPDRSDRPNYPAAWSNYSPHQKLEWRKEHDTNSTGFVGVKQEVSGRFSAKIFDPAAEKRIHIGTFDTAEEAGEAFENEFLRIYGERDEDGETDPDPHDVEGLREVMNQWRSGATGNPPEIVEMIQREILPLLTEDEP